MNHNPTFLTLAEGKLLVDILNKITVDAQETMQEANRQARETYAKQLQDFLLLIENEVDRNKLAAYMKHRMIAL